MTRQVWKFPLRTKGEPIAMVVPQGAEFVHVGQQEGQVIAWALVDPDAPRAFRRVIVTGTGWPIEHQIKAHLGTVQFANGLVWHAFELEPE